MNEADHFFLSQTGYPMYDSLPPHQAGPSSYRSSDGVSPCEQYCESHGLSPAYATEGFHQLNNCMTQCIDTSRTKTRYGPRDA